MKKIKLYLDENVHVRVAKELELRGYNIVTTQESGMLGADDQKQLEFASSEERCFVTFNVSHFYKLHTEYMEKGLKHHGIIISKQMPIGSMVKALIRLLARLKDKDMENRIEWLSNWL